MNLSQPLPSAPSLVAETDESSRQAAVAEMNGLFAADLPGQQAQRR